MSSRTCTKCRLHGIVEPLKGHKRDCPFANCSCVHCASHDNILSHKNSLRVDQNDKARLWRSSLSRHPAARASSASTSTPLLHLLLCHRFQKWLCLAVNSRRLSWPYRWRVWTIPKRLSRKLKRKPRNEKVIPLKKCLLSVSFHVFI